VAKGDIENDENLDEFEDEEVDETEDEAEDEAEDEDADADDSEEGAEDEPAAKKTDKSEKRIRDLQSQLDKAKAELNKVMKQAKANGGSEGPERDPEVQKWMTAAVEMTRTRVYESDPLFSEMGISSAAITGDTPEEMQASAKELSRLVKRIVTRTQNKVMREHGLTPEPRDSGREAKQSYASMSSEDFEKEIQRALRG
jgi:hypothetical protein